MMSSTPIRAIIFIVLLGPAVAWTDEFMPPDFTIQYALKKDNTVVGEMTRTLKRLDQNHFTFESSSKTTGLVALFYKNTVLERTSWKLHENRFIAENYHYLRVKRDKRRKVDIEFDWDNEKIITSVNDSSWSMPIQRPVYDKLLYQVALMYDLSAGRQVVTYQVADGGRMKKYFFEHVGNEVITTSVGKLKTVKLIRRKENRQDKTVLWCAPELHYLPVRVDTYEDDDVVVTARIKSLDGMEL